MDGKVHDCCAVMLGCFAEYPPRPPLHPLPLPPLPRSLLPRAFVPLPVCEHAILVKRASGNSACRGGGGGGVDSDTDGVSRGVSPASSLLRRSSDTVRGSVQHANEMSRREQPVFLCWAPVTDDEEVPQQLDMSAMDDESEPSAMLVPRSK